MALADVAEFLQQHGLAEITPQIPDERVEHPQKAAVAVKAAHVDVYAHVIHILRVGLHAVTEVRRRARAVEADQQIAAQRVHFFELQPDEPCGLVHIKRDREPRDAHFVGHLQRAGNLLHVLNKKPRDLLCFFAALVGTDIRAVFKIILRVGGDRHHLNALRLKPQTPFLKAYVALAGRAVSLEGERDVHADPADVCLFDKIELLSGVAYAADKTAFTYGAGVVVLFFYEKAFREVRGHQL